MAAGIDYYTMNHLADGENVPPIVTSSIYLHYQREEPEILEFCMENGISCFVSGRVLVIQTARSLWKIITNGRRNQLFLYHRNDPRIDYREDGTSLVPYFHSQAVRCSTIMEYLHYIVAHEEYREANPARRPRAKQPAPRKGTKRYRTAMRKDKEKERRSQRKHVYELIEQLQKK